MTHLPQPPVAAARVFMRLHSIESVFLRLHSIENVFGMRIDIVM
jgi:hypothetical protein